MMSRRAIEPETARSILRRKNTKGNSGCPMNSPRRVRGKPNTASAEENLESSLGASGGPANHGEEVTEPLARGQICT